LVKKLNFVFKSEKAKMEKYPDKTIVLQVTEKLYRIMMY
jgi:hypothetical protein